MEYVLFGVLVVGSIALVAMVPLWMRFRFGNRRGPDAPLPEGKVTAVGGEARTDAAAFERRQRVDEKQGPTESGSAAFGSILVPINVREPSHRAIRVAAELHRRFDARVCVFHAVHSDENDRFLAGLGAPISRSDLLEDGRAELRAVVQHVAPAEANAIECDVSLEESPIYAIRTKVREWGATLLVLSPEARSSLRRTHSEKLINSLAVPVLLLEPPGSAAAG